MVTKMKGVIWMKKESLFSIILLVLFIFILIGCAKEEVPVEPSVSPDKIKVNVIVDKNVSASVIEDLKQKGLIVSYETSENLVLTGEINKTEFGKLQNNSQIKVVKKKESQQLTDKDMQNIIDEARAKENITVGPYIRKKLLEELKDKEYAPAYIKFRMEYWGDNSKICLDEINSRLSKADFKLEEDERGALKGEITQEGVNKLRNVECILDIGWRDLSIPHCTVFENGTKTCNN